jgi:putative ABC transport system substrate-binding protein
MSTIGYVHSGSEDMFGAKSEPWKALKTALPGGVAINEKYANDDVGRLKTVAQELVDDKSVEVIVAAGGPQPALVLQSLTKTKPIVFTTVADPVLSKLVIRLDQPGHNLTGMAGKTSELDAERLNRLFEFSKAAIAKGDKIGVLLREGRDHAEQHFKKMKDKADEVQLKLKLIPREVSTIGGIKAAFDDFAKEGVKGVVVTADSFFNNNRKEVVAAAKQKLLPAIFQWKEFVDEGGLISYGPDILEAYQKAGEYVTQILGGKSPSTMACSEPSRFFTFTSSATARELGIEIPESLFGDPVQVI